MDDLRNACPDGADIYFESVGGEVFEAVLPLLNRDSRITLCGMISQYGNTDGGDAFEHWRETGRPTFDKQATQGPWLGRAQFCRGLPGSIPGRDGRLDQ